MESDDYTTPNCPICKTNLAEHAPLQVTCGRGHSLRNPRCPACHEITAAFNEWLGYGLTAQPPTAPEAELGSGPERTIYDSGLCCMVRHAQALWGLAVAPFKCDCPCHNEPFEDQRRSETW